MSPSAPSAPDTTAPTGPTTPLRGEDVDLSARSTALGGSPALRGYLVRPEGAGPHPSVVVVHEAFGLEDITRRQADRMAAMGYVALAPDLFTDGGPRKCLKSTFQALSSGEGRAFQDISIARQWLLDQTDTTDDVGIIGFCMGGGFALMCAQPGRGFAVSAVNYGQLPSTPEVLAGACPIVASYGGRDPSFRGTAAKLDHHLGRLGVQRDVKEYPKASHAFLNDADTGPWYLRPVFKVAGVGPEPTSAADAWERIEAFFAAHLRR
jgi:carboxymethylenebutenolidase